MSRENDYYGSDENQAISYLEFGSVNTKEKSKRIWGYWQDQEAYDLYMFARYARDIFSFRHFLDEEDNSINSLQTVIEGSAHVKLLDYIFKYAGIISRIHEGGVFCESGSSLYGLIEEVLALDKVFHDGKNSEAIKESKYLASDISEMMNEGAIVLHPSTLIEATTAPTIHKLVEDIKNRNIWLGLFYGLSVSIRYAIRESQDLIDMADVCDFQLYNRLSLSFGDTFTNVYGTGKTVYITSLNELTDGLDKKGLKAKYCTANMQHEKDGENSVRASVIIGKTDEDLNRYISEYNYCIDKVSSVETIEKGEWIDLADLRK